MKNKGKSRASFSFAPQTAKITDIARDKDLMKEEKDLNFWVKEKYRKRVQFTLYYYFI
jgi:hypothetical protein